MVARPDWTRRIEAAWTRKPVAWLTGVRRVGKTTLCQSLPGVTYLDCELPSVRRDLDDPEAFLRSHGPGKIVLDEVHRLNDPAGFLKIAADHFPKTRVLATGSSTLGASAKFRDTLTGRKAEVWLTPMVQADLELFGDTSLEHRMLHGGLPPFFLAPSPPERDFQEWVDAYWAKDIQELFRLERRHAFQRLFELLLAESGGIFEATRHARSCEVSRQTIQNYVAVLEQTFVVHVLRPFATNTSAEVVAAPKVYGFDTGFVAYHKGWNSLRREDSGVLWEHLVLNEIHALRQTRDLMYWRDKQHHEIDFVLPDRGRKRVLAIECKWRGTDFDAGNLKIFRRHYPLGENLVVVAGGSPSGKRLFADLEVRFVGLHELPEVLGPPAP